MVVYTAEAFFCSCRTHTNIDVRPAAVRDAYADFNIRGTGRLLDFIGNGGLENLRFDRSEVLRNHVGHIIPDREHPVWVDSYLFTSGRKTGYIAFLYNSVNGRWYLKSFKRSTCSLAVDGCLYNGGIT